MVDVTCVLVGQRYRGSLNLAFRVRRNGGWGEKNVKGLVIGPNIANELEEGEAIFPLA